MSRWPNLVATLLADWRELISLDAERMYLHLANEALARAKERWKPAARAHNRVRRLLEKEQRVKSRPRHDPRRTTDLEAIAIALVDGAQPALETAYGPAVAECALVHVLCCAAAEACINASASTRLSGKELEAFDRLSLEGKWLLLPRLCRRRGFNAGTEPFQSFASLVRYRNRLMHHRRSREPAEIGNVAPGILRQLGLSVPAAEKSLRTVKRLRARLRRVLGEPAERRGTATAFFENEYESEIRGVRAIRNSAKLRRDILGVTTPSP